MGQVFLTASSEDVEPDAGLPTYSEQLRRTDGLTSRLRTAADDLQIWAFFLQLESRTNLWFSAALTQCGGPPRCRQGPEEPSLSVGQGAGCRCRSSPVWVDAAAEIPQVFRLTPVLPFIGRTHHSRSLAGLAAPSKEQLSVRCWFTWEVRQLIGERYSSG